MVHGGFGHCSRMDQTVDDFPTQEEVKISLMRGPVKTSAICSFSLGVLTLMSGAIVIGTVGNFTVPLVVGSIQVVLGVFIIIGGVFAFRKYSNFRKRQERDMVAKVQQLAMGEGTIEAMLVEGGGSIPVLVPNDGSVLPKSIAIRLGKGDEDSPLPVIDMRPGLIVFFGVQGRDGHEVSVCMRDLFFGRFRFYPGMVPFHGLTVSFFLIGTVFINSLILVLTLSYPPDSSVYQVCSGLGTVAAVFICLSAGFGYRCYRAYVRGRSQQNRAEREGF
ncbi:uncharacterized protein LOC125043528 [Penaeus chinensis]|uniref:uncharacterized protein LOC125043528 n=1 Tax=Penaeus chinensis TaxID=139456 RepID=UPI001FB5D939|nr:uncharacterized protein LOC125043528 [Penaeus chinensis]